MILYAALPGWVQPPLTALVAKLPRTGGAENALASDIPRDVPLRSVLLRRRKGHAAGIFFIADQKLS